MKKQRDWGALAVFAICIASVALWLMALSYVIRAIMKSAW